MYKRPIEVPHAVTVLNSKHRYYGQRKNIILISLMKLLTTFCLCIIDNQSTMQFRGYVQCYFIIIAHQLQLFYFNYRSNLSYSAECFCYFRF